MGQGSGDVGQGSASAWIKNRGSRAKGQQLCESRVQGRGSRIKVKGQRSKPRAKTCVSKERRHVSISNGGMVFGACGRGTEGSR